MFKASKMAAIENFKSDEHEEVSIKIINNIIPIKQEMPEQKIHHDILGLIGHLRELSKLIKISAPPNNPRNDTKIGSNNFRSC